MALAKWRLRVVSVCLRARRNGIKGAAPPHRLYGSGNPEGRCWNAPGVGIRSPLCVRADAVWKTNCQSGLCRLHARSCRNSLWQVAAAGAEITPHPSHDMHAVGLVWWFMSVLSLQSILHSWQ